ncbi:MAG: hypothetical protein WKG52_01990 [Variovorax sp.]
MPAPISSNNIGSKVAGVGNTALLAFSALCSLSFMAWVLWFCQYGVDFRDEGFYLVWMADPFKYDVSVTQFGFVYHPLFELLRENVAAIRQVNLLVTFALAWAAGDRLLRELASPAVLQPFPRLVFAAALATSSLSFLHIWLPTPSYNWLVLQALLICLTGLLMARRVLPRTSLVGWLLLAVGGWLAFMAKPTSAAGLALCALVYLAASGKLALRPLLLCTSVAVVLLLGSAWVIDGSVAAFIERYRTGIALAELMGGGHKISLFLRLGELQLEPKTRNTLILGTLALASLGIIAATRIAALGYLAYSGYWLVAMATMAIVFGFAQKLLSTEYYRGLLLVIVPIAALILTLVVRRPREIPDTRRSRWALILLLLVLPYVYVFGTVNNYWWQISQAAVFWVLAGAVLASSPVRGRAFPPMLLPLALGAQLVTAAIVQTGIEAPYGQAISLRENSYEVGIGGSGSTLRLSPGFGAYLAQAADVAQRVGFAKGTPMLDLTGRSPTTLYTMGASNTGQAWMIGGYPGSDKLAAAMLHRVSCAELARAWLLVQPVGTTNISPSVLSSFGADIERDYEKVGTLVMFEKFSGYPELWTQQVLKPIRTSEAASGECAAGRSMKK